jgi:Alr-MurF fusion protein
MAYPIHEISIALGLPPATHPFTIDHLLLDSRRVHAPAASLFFALKGPRRDGHQFIAELYKKGVRNFVISEAIDTSIYPEANFLPVKDTLHALQQLAAWHRKKFNLPVIGITGSNGKTIVKEWLYELLQDRFHIVRSPKSYNSQIGVPLSVWQLHGENTLGLFEAGISQPGEMTKLEKVIQPTIGILTNIGDAHSEGFSSKEEKLREKLELFEHCAVIIGREEDLMPQLELINHFPANPPVLTWGRGRENALIVREIDKQSDHTIIKGSIFGRATSLTIPFTDDASIENALTCALVCLHLQIDDATRNAGMKQLHAVNMRLELKKAINHCTLINDSYSSDLGSLDIALDFLNQQSGSQRRTIILSDIPQSSIPDAQLYNRVVDNLHKHHVQRLIGIGPNITTALSHLVSSAGDTLQVELYSSTEEFLQQVRSSQFKEETILVKGARVFGFERIVQLLEQKVHQTLLEINLNALVHNLKVYQQQLQPSTKVMAMVKAFAYGSGGAEIAGILQYHKVDYLGVAYVDEGVELRRAGINLPVMVMNPEESSFDALVDHNLEPEIYSFALLEAFEAFVKKEGLSGYPVHIEIETGMNRLGFATEEIEKLGSYLSKTPALKVQSVFSHLASSEDPAQDDFTKEQFQRFNKAADELTAAIGHSFIRHIANSAAIVRHPSLQLDMVRLGIGMYGIDSADLHKLNLQTVATLRTTVAQVKHLTTGESVSYNRRSIVKRNSVIATVRLGYADGYPRRLGNAVGSMYIGGKLAPVIGTVCMDMVMLDVTDIPGIKEGDDVIVFGKQLPVQQLAAWAGTIPYEIMTGISQRVKRVYFEE